MLERDNDMRSNQKEMGFREHRSTDTRAMNWQLRSLIVWSQNYLQKTIQILNLISTATTKQVLAMG